jgi:hypothetical protein
MAVYIDLIAEDLSNAYRDAALSVVGNGFMSNMDTIAYGAMRCKQHREPIVSAALEVLIPLRIESTYRNDHYWENIDGHFSDDYWDHHADDDSGINATSILEAYVTVVRDEGEWRCIENHAGLKGLLPSWISVLTRGQLKDTSDEELIVVLNAASLNKVGAMAWCLIEEHWRDSLESFLIARLSDEQLDEDTRHAATQCALSRIPARLLEITLSLISQGENKSVLELIFDIYSASKKRSLDRDLDQAYCEFTQAMPSPFGEFCTAFATSENLTYVNLSAEALEILSQNVKNCQGLLQAQLIWMAAVNGLSLPELTEMNVIVPKDIERSSIALQAAIQTEMWHVVTDAIQHPRATIRQLAFNSLVARNDGVVPETLLGLARDKSNYIRKALVNALLTNATESDLNSLVTLCADDWTQHADSPDDDDDIKYPIARKATKVVSGLATIPYKYAVDLFAVCLATSDSQVRWDLFKALAAKGDEETRREIAQLVFSEECSPEIRLAASASLAEATDLVGEELVATAKIEWLLKAPSALAVVMSLVVGQSASESHILEIGDALATSLSRRVLLIPLIEGALLKHPLLAQDLMDRLPPNHKAKNLFEDVSDGKRLEAEILDDLGDDIRVTNDVLAAFNSRLETRRNYKLSR